MFRQKPWKGYEAVTNDSGLKDNLLQAYSSLATSEQVASDSVSPLNENPVAQRDRCQAAITWAACRWRCCRSFRTHRVRLDRDTSQRLQVTTQNRQRHITSEPGFSFVPTAIQSVPGHQRMDRRFDPRMPTPRLPKGGGALPLQRLPRHFPFLGQTGQRQLLAQLLEIVGRSDSASPRRTLCQNSPTGGSPCTDSATRRSPEPRPPAPTHPLPESGPPAGSQADLRGLAESDITTT